MNILKGINQWFLIFILSIFILLPGTGVGLFSPKLGLKCLRFWTYLCLKILKVEVKIIDENNRQYENHGILFVTLNQSSLLETLIGPMIFPTDFKVIVNFEFALIPLLGWIVWSIGAPVLIRQWPAQAKKTMNRIKENLSLHSNYWISIEGKRSIDGRLNPYKKGASVLAITAQAEIVPIWFHGARELMGHGSWRVKPGTVEVQFLKSIATRGLSYEDRDDLTASLRRIAESLDEVAE